jgi:chromate transport protein ChrA
MIFGHLWQSVALAAVLALVCSFSASACAERRAMASSAAAFMASLALPLAAFIPGETIVAGLLKQLNAPVAAWRAHRRLPVAPPARWPRLLRRTCRRR